MTGQAVRRSRRQRSCHGLMVLHRGGRCTGCFRYRRVCCRPGGRYCQCGGRRWHHRDRGHGHSRSSHGRSCAPFLRAVASGISRRRRFIILAEPQRHRDDGHKDQQSADHQQQKVPHLLHALPLPAQGASTCGHHRHSWGPVHPPCGRHPTSWERHGQPRVTLASTSRLHLPQADGRTAGPNGARSISYGRDLGAGTVTCLERQPTQTEAHRDRVPPQALWKRSGQHEPRKVPGRGAPFIEAVFQQANTYQRSRYSSDASRERSPLFRRTKASQAPANKKRPTRGRFSSGTDHGYREPITSSSWARPS